MAGALLRTLQARFETHQARHNGIAWADAKIVDGAVNGSGWAASEAGHAMQSTQSGKIGQYGALLFGAATVGAIVLVLVNVS